MDNLIWALCVSAGVLMLAVILPIVLDRPWEHQGATLAYAAELATWREISPEEDAALAAAIEEAIEAGLVEEITGGRGA